MLADGHGKLQHADGTYLQPPERQRFARKHELRCVKFGAYEVVAEENPDVILVASGSEVSTLAETATMLKEDGIKARVVSCPSEGLFRRQTKEYQEKLLPKNAKIFGLTAGLPVTFEGLVGANGKVHGLESFGFSAPYKVLDEKLGYTPQNIHQEVVDFLKSND